VSFDTLRQALEQRMAANWTATPVAYGNAPFRPPNNTEWVRFTPITGQGETLGIQGSSIYVRDRGLVSLQVFTPTEAGQGTAMGLVDDFLTLFEHKRFNGILTYTGSVTVIGPSDGWHQTNVTMPFRRVRNV